MASTRRNFQSEKSNSRQMGDVSRWVEFGGRRRIAHNLRKASSSDGGRRQVFERVTGGDLATRERGGSICFCLRECCCSPRCCVVSKHTRFESFVQGTWDGFLITQSFVAASKARRRKRGNARPEPEKRATRTHMWYSWERCLLPGEL